MHIRLINKKLKVEFNCKSILSFFKPKTLDHDDLSKIIDEESEDEGNYQCRHCFKLFITGQALGGHMSRKHPALR